MVNISTMPDAELQELYWTMKLDGAEAYALNEQIAAELSSRQIGIEQQLEDLIR